MMAFDIVFALTGDVRRNSRALRQLRVLAGAGWQVCVVSQGATDTSSWREPNLALRVVPRPAGGGPRFFAQWHRRVRNAVAAIPAQVYHASDLYVLPALRQVAQRRGVPFVYDARECYPHVAATVGRPWVSRFWQAVEHWHIRDAALVLTVSPSIAGFLTQTYGVPAPLVLYNAPPWQAVVPSDWLRAQTGVPESTPLVLHQGQMRQHRGCDRLLAAFADVGGAALVFLGDGDQRPRLQQQAHQLGLSERVFFLDPVPPDELLPITAGADLGVTLLEDLCLNHRYALPNKLFEYLMAGVPVLGSDLPEIRRVVQGMAVGRVVDPADVAALTATLQAMVADPAARARWAQRAPQVFETFGWETASQGFLAAYRRILR